MAQEGVWEKEYRNSKLLTKENKPQTDVVRFVKWMQKEKGVVLENLSILDLGSGTGRNSFYFAEMGNTVTGLEISKTAIEIGEANAKEAGLNIKYIKQSIGDKLPIEDKSMDILLDVTSSNSLNESEREIYLNECKRVLKDDGYFFTKALCKDGDANAKYLLKNFGGKEQDTYTMPGLGVTERVWSKDDFIKTYEKYFKILHTEKKTSYPRMNDRVYKRNYCI
ncbi:MAG: class I SAM-dependent methyltransferase, partial [Parcubacteria group bacterium]